MGQRKDYCDTKTFKQMLINLSRLFCDAIHVNRNMIKGNFFKETKLESLCIIPHYMNTTKFGGFASMNSLCFSLSLVILKIILFLQFFLIKQIYLKYFFYEQMFKYKQFLIFYASYKFYLF